VFQPDAARLEILAKFVFSRGGGIQGENLRSQAVEKLR
jgi:hypothetical protein